MQAFPSSIPGRREYANPLVGPDLNSEAGAEMTIEGGALVLRPPASPVRAGWAEAAQEIAEAGDDALVMGEFGNVGDEELVW